VSNLSRLIGLGAALLLLSACSAFEGGSGSTPSPEGYRPQPPAQRGGTLAMSDFEYPRTLSPLSALTDLELRLGALAFSPLWGFDDQLRPYPDLALQVPTPANGGVKTAANGRSMTVDVKLAGGLRWSDGLALTADDVLFTLQAVRDPATQAVTPPGLDRIKDARRVSAEELLLTFDGVYAPYLEIGAALFVLPAHRLQAIPHAQWSHDLFFQRPDVSSGPFMVKEAVPGGQIVFQANPRYPIGGQAHRHTPNLDQLVFKAQSGKPALLAALRSRGADLAFHLTPNDLPTLTGMAASSPLVTYGLRDQSLRPNHAANSGSGQPPPWLNDRRVLDALDRALDRSELVRQALAGAGKPARGVYPRALRGYAKASRIAPSRDLETAQRLLADAGWSRGSDGVQVKGGRRLEFGLVTICGSGLDDRVMQMLRSQWQDLGAGVTTSCLSRDDFLRATDRGAFDMALASDGWGPDPNDWAALAPDQDTQSTWRCEDDDLEAAFRRGASTLNFDARRAAYLQAEREWLDYNCTVPLLELPQISQVSTRLHNFSPSPGYGLETWNAADWWLSPAPPPA
jgi:peptide/nickel transport system substrate-binding protein